jgi:DNA-binding MurR/RpiR family transcriptional regulator
MKNATTNGACLARVRTRLYDASESVSRIARFIVNSPSEACAFSIKELAEACGVSISSVSRFAKILDYRNFQQFRLDLASSVAKSEIVLEDFGPGVSPEGIIRQVFECNREGLAETLRILDHQTMIRVARIVERARRILIFGLGGSAEVAREAEERFLSLGLTAVALEDPYHQIFGTANIGPKDVAIGVSHTGETSLIVNTIQRARRKRARTVALTNYPQSSLAVAAEFVLLTSFKEHRINAAVSSSRIAQMCVIDAIYFLLGSWSGKRATSLANEIELRTKQLLRS